VAYLGGLQGALTAAGLAASFKMYKHYHIKDQRNQQLQKENTDAQIRILMAQIHPHFLFNTLNNIYSQAQEEPQDTAAKELNEVVISANKFPEKKLNVAQRIDVISSKYIARVNAQNTGDLLINTGNVFVQKSQSGGGSPIIRGFATNRVLIVVDGVRMNNAIYRSGNIQNVISVDPLATEDAEVIFGPGSMIYGSDAIGGVMDFHSLKPRYTRDEQTLVKGSVFTRYSTANKEKTLHADLNLGWKKLSVLSSFSYSSYDDMRMGKFGGQDSYLRPEYVARINDVDSIVKNSDPRVQVFSGYEQWNFLQKMAYRLNDQTELQYNFTYSGTGDAPRYDRLIQYRQGKLRFAEWYYGPMIWRMHQLKLQSEKKGLFWDEHKLILAYQDYDESRFDRTVG